MLSNGRCVAVASGDGNAVRAVVSCETLTKFYVPDSDLENDEFYIVVREQRRNSTAICPEGYQITGCMAWNSQSRLHPNYTYAINIDINACQVTECETDGCTATAVCVQKQWTLNWYRGLTNTITDHIFRKKVTNMPIFLSENYKFVKTSTQESKAHCLIYGLQKKAPHVFYHKETETCALFSNI